MSKAGRIRDQILAAVITPAAKPNMSSFNFLPVVLSKNTEEEPNVVTAHVKRPEKRERVTGFAFSSIWEYLKPLYGFICSN